MKQLDKIEKLLEYQYMSVNYQHLMQTEAMLMQRLKKSPSNIMQMGQLERVRHDMKAIAGVMAGLQKELLNSFEDANDVELKYMINRNAEQKPNGKGVSFTGKKGEA